MSEENNKNTSKNNPYLVPGAIVIAGILIAIAIIANKQSVPQQPPTQTEIKGAVMEVTDSDHVLGSKNPDVYLIEYSDYKCGYCGLFHDTITQILEEYEGRVAWVYRHTPYQPGGKEAAVASECVAEQLGEEGFWAYTNDALKNQRDQNSEWHRNKAVELGANGEKFDECITSGKFDDLIASHTMNAQELGGQGTPFNVLLTKKGGVIKFSGAQPKDNVKIFIERALKTLE